MYDAYDSVVSWMIAGGARIDQPDTRYHEHQRALREARQTAHRSIDPFAWIRKGLRAKAPASATCDPLACSAAA